GIRVVRQTGTERACSQPRPPSASVKAASKRVQQTVRRISRGAGPAETRCIPRCLTSRLVPGVEAQSRPAPTLAITPPALVSPRRAGPPPSTASSVAPFLPSATARRVLGGGSRQAQQGLFP